VHVKNWRELLDIDVTVGQAAELITRLERRVRGLHPVLQDVEFTHRWGGPILIADQWRPVFETPSPEFACRGTWRLQRTRRGVIRLPRKMGGRGDVGPKETSWMNQFRFEPYPPFCAVT